MNSPVDNNYILKGSQKAAETGDLTFERRKLH